MELRYKYIAEWWYDEPDGKFYPHGMVKVLHFKKDGEWIPVECDDFPTNKEQKELFKKNKPY